jgi:hypothetical protein
LDAYPEQLCNAIDTLSRLREDEGKTEEAPAAATRARECRTRASGVRLVLSAAPPADRDLTNLPESLKALEQHLASSLERVRAAERAI